jgi:hypothetical protein
METNSQQDQTENLEQHQLDEEQAIDEALRQMTSLYISRCVQTPLGANVTIREIDDKE